MLINKLKSNRYLVLLFIITIIIFLCMYIYKKYRFNKENPTFWKKGKDARVASKIGEKHIIQSSNGSIYSFVFWFYIKDWKYKFKNWKHIFTRGHYTIDPNSLKDNDNSENNRNICNLVEDYCWPKAVLEIHKNNLKKMEIDDDEIKKILEKRSCQEGYFCSTKFSTDNSKGMCVRGSNIKGKSCISKDIFNKLKKISNNLDYDNLNCSKGYICRNSSIENGKITYGNCFKEEKERKKCIKNADPTSIFACEPGYTCLNYNPNNNNYGECEIIKGNLEEEIPIEPNFTVSPAVFFTPNINNIKIAITNEDGLLEYFTVKDIPIQKWTMFSIILNNTNLSIYIDNRLTETFILKKPAKESYGDLHITKDLGFNGLLSNFHYTNKVISSKDINKLYKKGPKQSIIEKILIYLGLNKRSIDIDDIKDDKDKCKSANDNDKQKNLDCKKEYQRDSENLTINFVR